MNDTMAAAHLLTVVIPTHNRLPFLLRALRYYQACRAPWPVLVLDSSDDAGQPGEALTKQLAAITAQYAAFDRRMFPLHKLRHGVEPIATPYAVLMADDDFLVPRALAAAVHFLEGHGEFSTAHGRSGLFRVTARDGAASQVEVGPYKQSAYEDGTAAQRLLHYLRDYATVFYSVQRTANLRANLERCACFAPAEACGEELVDRSDWWIELTLGCLAVIQGKAAQVDALYMLRERHASADSWSGRSQGMDLFEWITSATFPSAYDAYGRCVSEALAAQDRLDLGAAREVVKQAFWAYLAQALARKWQGRYEPARAGVLGRVRAAIQSRRTGCSIEALLRPSSGDHRDFLPIYDAVTEQA
jgi:glycosyltransferase domain-containing protein